MDSCFSHPNSNSGIHASLHAMSTTGSNKATPKRSSRKVTMMGSAVMDRPAVKSRIGGGSGSGGFDDGGDDNGDNNNGGRGRGGRGDGGRGDGRDNSGSGNRHKRITLEEKYQTVNQLIFTCLIKVLPIEEINKIKDDPFVELQYMTGVRNFLESEGFPYKKAWDLKTRKLHFYVSTDELKEKREGIDVGLVNKTFADQLNKDKDAEGKDKLVLLNQDYEYVI